jgi:hypothetical protein
LLIEQVAIGVPLASDLHLMGVAMTPKFVPLAEIPVLPHSLGGINK